MSAKKDALQIIERLGLHLDTWSPGDGVTRYRVFAEPSQYFEGQGLYTALGPAELLAWARGYSAGYYTRNCGES